MKLTRHGSSYLLISLAVLVCVSQAQKPAGDDSFGKSIQPFFAKNCYACHSSKLKVAGFDLEQYQTAASVAQDRGPWASILEKLHNGQMPPKGAPQPAPADVKSITAWIEGEFDRADGAVKPSPGRVTARRLNRAEYNNTIRDLLGVDFRPADDFPQDDSGYGFDVIGDVLSLSPVLMEKYLSAAEKVVDLALFGPGKVAPTAVLHQPPYRAAIDGGDASRFGLPPYTVTNYDLTGLSHPSALHTMHTFPVEGLYEFRISPEGNRPRPSDPFQVVLWIEGKPAHTLQLQAPAQSFEGQDEVFRMRAPAGEHWLAVSALRLYEGLPAVYGGLNQTKLTEADVPARGAFAPRPPPADATPEELAEFQRRQQAQAGRQRNARPPRISDVNFRVNFLRISGPFEQGTGGASPESLKRIFTCGHLDGHHQPSCARKIVSDLAGRAYRRPLEPQEATRFLTLISQAQKRGDSFEKSIGVAVEAMLVSPHFLFRIEAAPKSMSAGVERVVSQYELASRLSYFLWSSMPDGELLSAARQNKLRQPEVLAAQVKRMLQDPKAKALVENFGGQWLQTRALESSHPDPMRFPYFDEYLRMSMRKETELFFENIIREDRSALDFLDARYTFLNEALARHYEIPGITGPEFRRVDLTGTHRGGILGQASVLTVSSYATRTSVVLRGKWVLENLLNYPIPPPPSVPLIDDAVIGTSMSLRQQMEVHRTDAICASCHSRMDPIGFGLENYDATGKWRNEDGKFPIVATGSLPSGKTFDGPDGLRELLTRNPAAFAECLSEKMLTYALGRGLEPYDKPAVKTIASHWAGNNYRFSSLVLGIVNSLPFQNTTGD